MMPVRSLWRFIFVLACAGMLVLALPVFETIFRLRF